MTAFAKGIIVEVDRDGIWGRGHLSTPEWKITHRGVVVEGPNRADQYYVDFEGANQPMWVFAKFIRIEAPDGPAV